MKYAVYVEGQSELLFVADVLQKYSNYNPASCGFLCINLTADDFERMTFPQQGDVNSANYYQIVNVNNDNLVVSKLRKDIPRLLAQGYNVILGLRDVYSDTYKQITANQPVIDRAKIEQMHAAQTLSINAPAGIDCRLHFAIMEYEAWMLALIDNYIVSKGQKVGEIVGQIGVDITNDDLETSVYHPYPLAQKIYQACGEDYHKHGKESLSFLSTLTMADYEHLRHSVRCASFSKFIDSLLSAANPSLP